MCMYLATLWMFNHLSWKLKQANFHRVKINLVQVFERKIKNAKEEE